MERTRSRRAVILAITMVLLMNAGQFVSAEIPHENFDLVSADLDMVVQLLTQGINATEMSLVSCLEGRPEDGSRNLTLLDSILVPATQLISQIQDIASSYYSLEYLALPFENLSAGGHRFIVNQSVFLSDLNVLRSYVGSGLSPLEASAARHSTSEARAAVFSMNDDLDTMDGAAVEIAGLKVKNSKVFDTTYLQELIDRLRILLDGYQGLLDSLFFMIQWGPKPFILIVTDKEIYPLGETVRITGYLFNGPTPLVGKPVEIWKDGVLFNTTFTNINGTFNAYWPIPWDKAQLGYHDLSAQAIVGIDVYENSTRILVVKIPTVLRSFLNGNRYSPGELIVATAFLVDYKDRPVIGRYVTYSFDNNSVDLLTSDIGRTELQVNASEFDWGRHTFTVNFHGTSIYDPSMNDTLHFEVNLNTSLFLALSDNRVSWGEDVRITATLYASGLYTKKENPLQDRDIAIMFDGEALATGPSGEDGKFVFVLNTSRIPAGTHVLKALFLSHDPKYEDAVSEELLLIVSMPSSGENNNGGGWWKTVAGNFIWLLLLIIIVIILAILMLSKDRIQNAMKTDGRGTYRIRAKKDSSEDAAIMDSEFPVESVSPLSVERAGTDFATLPPRVAIIKRYGILLDALRSRMKVPIRANMTAREIGQLLKVRGYPEDEMSKLTAGFEKAMYSAEEIVFADWERFGALADSIQNFSGGNTG